MKNFLAELLPEPKTRSHPKSSYVGQLTPNDAGTAVGPVLTKRKTKGAVASDPGHQPVIREDGSVVPGIVPGDVSFTANPVTGLSPLLNTIPIAPTAISQYAFVPVPVVTPKTQGIPPYAPGVSGG